MPSSIIIDILSCLPILDMIRIRPTCKLVNECSNHGSAWRHSLDKLDEMRCNVLEFHLYERLKSKILTASMSSNIQPRPQLSYLSTRFNRYELDNDLVCDVLDYFSSKSEH